MAKKSVARGFGAESALLRAMQLEQLGTVALASLVTALAASRPAAACGGTPLEVVMALPRPSAVGVPLNAALITSSNMTLAQIWLRRVDGAPPGFESDAAPPATPADAGLGQRAPGPPSATRELAGRSALTASALTPDSGEIELDGLEGLCAHEIRAAVRAKQ